MQSSANKRWLPIDLQSVAELVRGYPSFKCVFDQLVDLRPSLLVKDWASGTQSGCHHLLPIHFTVHGLFQERFATFLEFCYPWPNWLENNWKNELKNKHWRGEPIYKCWSWQKKTKKQQLVLPQKNRKHPHSPLKDHVTFACIYIENDAKQMSSREGLWGGLSL